jgi:predicted O-methyltransferase YrrM
VRKKDVYRGDFLVDLVHAHDFTRGAELGLWKGRTYFHLLDRCPELTLVGVDQWQHHLERANIPGGETYAKWNMRGLEATVRTQAEKYGERATLLKMSTVAAAASFPDGYFDFVFIDADHSEAGVRSDIHAWKPKVRPGGFLTGHDIVWPTVKKIVAELLPGYQQNGTHSDAVWFIQQ